MQHFDYSGITATAIRLVKQFGRKVPCSLLRTVEGTPADASLPWRIDSETVKEFKFIGVVTMLGFSKLGTPTTDQDTDVIIPGDITITAAEGDPGTLCGEVLRTDVIQSGASRFGILGIQRIAPDDDDKVIIYKVRCRAWPQPISPPQTPF